MGGRSYVLEEATLGTVRGSDVEVAILPWGATEPHSLHLPFGTDSIQVAVVARKVARISGEAGTRVVVLPTIPFGVNTQQSGGFFEKAGDRAGELETSVMLHLVPDLVQPLEQAGSGEARTFKLRGLREGVHGLPETGPA